jgi:hypothetical protein
LIFRKKASIFEIFLMFFDVSFFMRINATARRLKLITARAFCFACQKSSTRAELTYLEISRSGERTKEIKKKPSARAFF